MCVHYLIVFFHNICILLLLAIIVIIIIIIIINIIISLLLYFYIRFFPFISISLHNVLTSFVNKRTVNARHANKALIMLTGIYSLLEMQFKGWI